MFKIKMGSNEVGIEAEVMFSLPGEKVVGKPPNCGYVKGSGITADLLKIQTDGVACLKVVNTENSCTIKNECTEHVKMIDVAANNVASTQERCGKVIAKAHHHPTLDPKEEKEYKDQTNCCVNKAVKISADSKKMANEAWAAKHAKCPACMEQKMSADGKYCMIRNTCPNAIKLYLPDRKSALFDDNRQYSQEPKFCYGRCPEPYVPPPACLVLVQGKTDKALSGPAAKASRACTFTNNCDTELDWVIETVVSTTNGIRTGSRSGASIGAGETARYGGTDCAEVKVKNDMK